jgi:hypothetical protein
MTIVQTKSDGSFDYNLNYSLDDGEHVVYITSLDQFGQVVNKSYPYSFFIKDSRVVDLSQYLDKTELSTEEISESFINIFSVFAGVIIVVVAAILTLFYILLKTK